VKRLAAALLVVILIAVGVLYVRGNRSPSPASEIRSGIPGGCLDVFHDATTANAVVDVWGCNGGNAQDWKTTATSIRHTANSCLAVGAANNIVLSTCAQAATQVWLRDQQGYFNPNSGKCLSTAQDGLGKQLVLASCTSLSTASETWQLGTISKAMSCSGSEGQTIACDAAKEWTAWQAKGSNHTNLLTAYTDGTPYEEWCADFVSYVYKEAGFAFTQGSADGWDENSAAAVQNMGFTKHLADSDYQPQVGDVAYFDYSGGHVEIVISGGKHPTFIYGDSATIDPATGNGQMEANTIAQDGTAGQVVYYLSPNG
jgi:hypothetical protein